MSFTIGSLFDGSGGFPLAAVMCGGTPVWASEVEPYTIAVTKSRFPKMKHLGSVTDINGAEIEPVDVITFGSPCQDLSVAGKRAGLKHESNGDDETTRSGLFMEAIRIIKEMREATNGAYPRIALWENVPGAFSSNKGEDFRIVLEEFIKIVEPSAVMPDVPKNGWSYADSYTGDGWSLAYRVFDAQYWGVPQRRRRIYLVADFTGECAGEILFKREGLRGYLTESRETGEGITDDTERGSGTNDREGENGCIAFHLLQDPVPNDRVSPCMGQGNVDLYNQCLTGDKAACLSANSCMTATRNGPSVVEAVGLDGYNSTDTGDKAATLWVNCGMSTGRNGVIYAVDQGGGKSGANFYNDLSPTLTWTHGGEPAIAYDEMSGFNTTQYLFENHGQDCRFRGPLSIAPTCQAGYGEGGSTKPYVVESVLCMATQQGGAEIMEDKCPTITAAAGMSGNNQPVVCVYNGENITSPLNKTNPQPGDPCHTLGTDSRNYVVCCIDGDKIGKAERSGGSGLGIREGDKMYTLTAKDAGTHGVCYSFEPGIAKREGGENRFVKDCSTTLRANMGDNQTAVVYSFDSLASNSMKSSNPHSGCRAVEISKTLDTTDPNPSKNQGEIAIVEDVTVQTYQKVTGPLMANSHPGSYTGQDAFSDMLVAGVDYRNFTESPELYPTLQAKPNGGQSLNYSGAVRTQYIVRRLTPTECARLQGFPDTWGYPDQKAEFTDEEYEFWLNVRNTHAEITGKATKEYTKQQMLTWYNKLHTDSSEYKMWGNGIALPCALYVMEGIADAIH